MPRPLAALVCLTAIGLSTPARAQFSAAPTPQVATPPFPALTKTVLPEVPKNSPTGNETFVLETAMSIDLDDAPSGPAGFDRTTAYVPLGSGRVVAVDLEQSTLRWSHDINTALAPVVDNGLVVIAGDEQLAAFDAATGAGRWSVPVAGGFSAPPLLDSGWVVAAASGGDILTIRAADGQVLWTKSLGTKVVARPFIAGDAVYFSLDDGRIVKLALLSGEPQWDRKLPGRPGELLVLDDRLFVGAGDKKFYCLDPKNGKERWHWRTGGKPVGAATVDEKRVYYAPLDNILWALDRQTGVMRWRAEMPVRPASQPILMGSVVAVAAVALEIYGFRAKTGAPLGKIVVSADLAGPPQLLPGVHPLVSSVAAVTKEGTFMLLRRRLEPAPLPMPYPLGDEIPLTTLGPPPSP